MCRMFVLCIPFDIFLAIRLEEEGANNQKLLTERAAAESKIKGLEEQMTLSEDNVSKVTDHAINDIIFCKSIFHLFIIISQW